MFSSAAFSYLGDPTDHGSNVGAVALFALGIFALIGLLAFLITRRGRRPSRAPAARARPMPGPRQGPETAEPAPAQDQSAATDAKAQ